MKTQELSPAQAQLLELWCHLDAPDVLEGLETTFQIALFQSQDDLSLEDRSKMWWVKMLIDKVKAIKDEGSGQAVA